MSRKLCKIELAMLVGVSNIIIAEAVVGQEPVPAIFLEFNAISKKLLQTWEQVKQNRLWAISVDKEIVENPEFIKESGGQKCLITYFLDKFLEETCKRFVADEKAILAKPVVTTTTTVVTTTTAALSEPKTLQEIMRELKQ